MSDITMCTLHSEKPYYITEINKNISRAFDFFFINAGMTQTVEAPRLATGGWLDLTRQAFHLLDYSPLSGRTIPI